MCCSGDSSAKSLESTQAAFVNTLNASYQTTFAEQQATLAKLSTQLNYMISNPHGFSPADLAAMRTSATDMTAGQFQKAMAATGAYAASHGGADLSSGVQAGITAGVATAGAQEQSREQLAITQANEQMKMENYWKSISGLGTVAGLQNPAAYAGESAGVAKSSVDAGQLLLASKQAGWQDVGGVISGIAGLGLSVATGGLSEFAKPAISGLAKPTGNPETGFGAGGSG